MLLCSDYGEVMGARGGLNDTGVPCSGRPGYAASECLTSQQPHVAPALGVVSHVDYSKPPLFSKGRNCPHR